MQWIFVLVVPAAVITALWGFAKLSPPQKAAVIFVGVFGLVLGGLIVASGDWGFVGFQPVESLYEFLRP